MNIVDKFEMKNQNCINIGARNAFQAEKVMHYEQTHTATMAKQQREKSETVGNDDEEKLAEK